MKITTIETIRTSFSSATLDKLLTATWKTEEWTVRNLPRNVKLLIKLYYKDDSQLCDECLEKFEIDDLVNFHSPVGGQQNGKFHLSIHITKSSDETIKLPQYTFDGPCRFFNYHFSTIVGHFSIWKIELRRIPFFFHSNRCQSIRDLYNHRANHFDMQQTMQKTRPIRTGHLKSTDDLWSLIFKDRTTDQIRPCIYNYIIDDHAWYFSETGHQFFGSTTNKHALLANCSDSIRFAGEFHPRPKRGWHNWSESEWEFVFDNASGTYSPHDSFLDNVKQLFLFNFPQLNILTYDYKDPLLQYSIDQLQIAARSNRYKKHDISS